MAKRKPDTYELEVWREGATFQEQVGATMNMAIIQHLISHAAELYVKADLQFDIEAFLASALQEARGKAGK